MIKVSHIVACPIVFIFFYDRDWQGGVLKNMKNDNFLVLLTLRVLFPSFGTG